VDAAAGDAGRLNPRIGSRIKTFRSPGPVLEPNILNPTNPTAGIMARRSGRRDIGLQIEDLKTLSNETKDVANSTSSSKWPEGR
jgi:hypothetical protein